MRKYKSPSQVIKLGGKKQSVSQVLVTKQVAGDELDLFIYDVIEPDGYSFFGDEIQSETSADWFRQQLEDTSGVRTIRLFVNSAGGDVVEAMGIRAQLLRHPAQVIGYVDGWAASAASFVLTACDEIYMLTGSMQFLHNMWTVAVGNADDLRAMAAEMDQMMISNRQMYLERAGDKLTEGKLVELMDGESWLSAEESVGYGLADYVMPATEYKTLVQQRAKMELSDSPGVEVDVTPPEHTEPTEPEPEPEPEPTEPGPEPEPTEPPKPVADEQTTEPEDDAPKDQVIEDTSDEPVNQLAIFMAALIGGEEE